MKKNTKHLSVYLLLLVLACSLAFAGGYQINEHGARAMGMGGAFVARASDGSAMFFNAAGLGFQTGKNVLVGTTLIFPSSSFTGPLPATTETKMVSQVFYPSNLYASYAINEKWVVGLGVYNPFGLGSEWPSDWPTTTNKSGSRRIVKTDLQTYYINPTVAYKVNDKLSVGAGVSYVLASAKISYRVGTYSSLPPTLVPATVDGTAGLDGTGNGISINAGIIYKPTEKLSLGASYRSLVKVEFSGAITFTGMQALQPYTPGGTGKVTLPMPSNLQIGAAYVVTPKLTVEGDFQYVDWSSYDQLAITLPNGPPVPQLGGVIVQKSGAPVLKKWHEGWLLRLGGEYKLNDKVDLRAGFIYDYTPQPTWGVEPMLPDANKTDVSLGASYKVNEKISVDAAYMLVMFADRASTLSGFSGTYKSSANLLSVNFGYHF